MCTHTHAWPLSQFLFQNSSRVRHSLELWKVILLGLVISGWIPSLRATVPHFNFVWKLSPVPFASLWITKSLNAQTVCCLSLCPHRKDKISKQLLQVEYVQRGFLSGFLKCLLDLISYTSKDFLAETLIFFIFFIFFYLLYLLPPLLSFFFAFVCLEVVRAAECCGGMIAMNFHACVIS